MTEAEWQAATDPKAMLRFLEGKVSDRKLRLFGVLCCQDFIALLDPRSLKALNAAGRFADGRLGSSGLSRALTHATQALQESEGGLRQGELVIKWLCHKNMSQCEGIARESAEYTAAQQPRHMRNATRRVARSRRASAIRDIFGNPFRPVTADPSWLTSTVLALAEGIYVDRAFDRMPILADALQDAGCENEDILNHSRQPGEHVRGCWAVDLLLGKV